MEGTSNGEDPNSWEELYNMNLMPTEIFLKFRKEIQGFRLGVNLEVFVVIYLYSYVVLCILLFETHRLIRKGKRT